MTIKEKDWNNYIKKLSRLSGIAGDLMRDFIGRNGVSDRDALIKYASGLVLKYGEATSELACLMYDAIAEAQKVSVPLAVPADVATVGEVAKAVNGTLKQSPSGQLVDSAVQRLVKQAGADTILQNATRDGAWFAWITRGDTCPYCQMISAIGWQRAGKKTINKTHAEHIHSHCDCQYVVDFKGGMEIEGYDPDEMQESLLKKAYGENWEDYSFDFKFLKYNGKKGTSGGRDELNKIRRSNYEKNKDFINEQKRKAYAKRKESE